MADADIVCNYSKCRKRLTSAIWVTSCSHAFCDDDGSRQFCNDPENNKCPACNTPLNEKYDVVKVDLNPSEQFKSMILAGLRPEIVLDIATRAISFWSYQVHQERIFQECCASKLRERQHQIEEQYESIVTNLKTEVAALKRQLQNTKMDVERQTKRAEAISEQLRDKIQQYQKLQVTCSALRRATLASTLSECGKRISKQSESREFSLGPKYLMETMPPKNSSNQQFNNIQPEQGFNFQPVTPEVGSSNATRLNTLWEQKK